MPWQGVLTDVTEAKTLGEAPVSPRPDPRGRELRGRTVPERPSWSDVVADVLARVGSAAGASRAAVFATAPPDGRCLAQVVEWTASVTTDDPPRDHDGCLVRGEPASAAGTAPCRRAISRGRPGLPDSERDRLELGHPVAGRIPIVAGGEWWGHVVCDQSEEARIWQDAELDAMRVIANTLGAAIGRERASRRLAEAEARYRSLIEQIPAITYMESATEPGTVLYISPQVETILGIRNESWSHESWLARIHPDDHDRVTAEDERTARTGEPLSVEYRMRRPDGDVVWIQDDAVLLRDDQGAPLYWQGVRFDITSRKEAEDQLREAEERFRRLVEQMPAITYIDERAEDGTDGDGDGTWPTTYISPQVSTILGYTAREFEENPNLWDRIVHPDDRGRALEADRRHYRTRRAARHGAPCPSQGRLAALAPRRGDRC